MPELRFDPIKRHWVIIADRRAKRPSEFSLTVNTRSKDECPFCPGHEAQTPEAILEDRKNGEWDLRLIPNKFPAVNEGGILSGELPAEHLVRAATGRHEVVIESPHHDDRQAQYPDSRITRILTIFQSRIREFMRSEECRYVVVFTNVGYRGGATLVHPHSQIIGLPLVPPVIERELDSAVDFHRENGRCLFCDVLDSELKADERVFAETEEYAAFCPYASRFAWEFTIFPKVHACSLMDLDDSAIAGLGKFLLGVLGRMDEVLKQPDYNILLHIAPKASQHQSTEELERAFHWHLEVIPRVSTQAGMEWGSGAHINSTPPETAAAAYRRVLA